MSTSVTRAFTLALALAAPMAVFAQTPPPAQAANAAPRQSGTVKAVTPNDFVLTTAGGQDFAVTVPAKARILIVPPGARDLSTAQPGTMGDLAAGDRAIVNGTAGDTGPMLTATRVIVMKSGAIAATHQAEEAEWARGVGGIVRSVDAATGVITISSGMRTVTVTTTPATIVRRYSGGSVRFEDAVRSSVAEIHPGDQLRARGERSPDGNSVAANEIVTGSFSHFSGVLSAVNQSAGTVTLKDLATKRTVTIAVTNGTNLRRLPAGGGMGAGAGAHGQAGGAGEHGAGSGSQGQGMAGGQAHAAGGYGRAAGNVGADLSRIMNRLPTETLADLKPGDAVMIVASNGQAGEPSAVTLLAGVEQILAAHPSGETTLSPWSLGGEGGGEGDMGGGGAGPQ